MRTWQGAPAFADATAVERWSFSFDNPQQPTETMITDPLGNTMTYFLGYDPSSTKHRLEKTTGDCPTCGLGPNTQLFYEDATNPLRATREVDGRGITTLYTYDANGRTTSRTEAFGTALERQTTWTYNPTWPALLATVEQPSVEGFPNVKLTTTTYDLAGNPDTRTVDGFEDGVAFSHTTDLDHNAAGQIISIDPPGYATADETTYAYDPTRGNGLLVLESHTDPILGTTTYGSDPFNRRTSVTDVNGVLTKTQYDDLNRVTMLTQHGATPADDLITEYRYNVFGDLFQTVLPEGNVIEYSYDATGRLLTVERKPDDQPTSHGERTVYTYNAVGNRVLEEQETWDGAMWVKRSQTETIYTTRCQADKIIRGFGGDEATTEFAYDCEGNLERVWDANHPSMAQTVPATTEYVYDDLSRLTEMHQPFGGAGGGTSVTAYAYDAQDHLNQITDAEGGLTTYNYSDRDLLTEEISEVSGTTTYAYNEHGELTTRTDARGITETRTLDELDRVTFIDYPNDTLDITHTYDDVAAPFSLGRLTSIERDGHAVAITYDRFGRQLQDGELLYAYDKNGNRTEVGYPGGVMAIYTYDYADRQATLTVTQPGEPDKTVVTSASYEPSGPQTSVTLGNGLTEARGFDTRYYPSSIVVSNGGAPIFDWQYNTDPEGNITNILDSLDATNQRTYGYQDVQYFLTQGDGPWGDLSWTYDRIGNRQSETRDGTLDTYLYVPNGAGGNSAQLQEIQLGAGGTRTYSYDLAGNQDEVGTVGELVERTYDAAGRMSRQESGDAATDFLYDGRDFLRRAVGQFSGGTGGRIFCDGFESGDLSVWGSGGGGSCVDQTGATYSSDGLLYSAVSKTRPAHLLYFADRPVAQLDVDGDSLNYLTTDHLGTPAMTSDPIGTARWQGGFEPFGRDFSGASDAGVFLRFPGQWVDGAWSDGSGGFPSHYNIYRWYHSATGRYNRVDPTGFEGSSENLYIYAEANPVLRVDLQGLTSFKGFSPDKQRTLEQAIENAKKKLKGSCCAGTLTSSLLEKLAEATFIYKSDLDNCGRVTSLGHLQKKIQLGPKSFEFSKCCHLESTVVHEVNHLRKRNRGEEASRKLEKDCFGCE